MKVDKSKFVLGSDGSLTGLFMTGITCAEERTGMPFLDIVVTLEFHPSKNGAVACRIHLVQDIADLLRETSNSTSHYIGLLARATIRCTV